MTARAVGIVAAALFLYSCSGGGYESPTAPTSQCSCSAPTNALGEVAPSCPSPAPLIETPEYVPNSYVVVFYPEVDVQSTTSALGSQYCFTADSVWVNALHGFSATMTPCAVAALRCRAEVQRVSRNAIFHAFGAR